jgi:hypothetical protein
MDKNIVFQVVDRSLPNPSWSNSKIVYVLKCAPENYDITDLVDAISVVLDDAMVRTSRLDLNEPITLDQANKHSGGYYQSHHKLTPPVFPADRKESHKDPSRKG